LLGLTTAALLPRPTFAALVPRVGPDIRVTEVLLGEVDSPYFATAGEGTSLRLPGIASLVKPILSTKAAARAVWDGAASGDDMYIRALHPGRRQGDGGLAGFSDIVRFLFGATAWKTTVAEVRAAWAKVNVPAAPAADKKDSDKKDSK